MTVFGTGPESPGSVDEYKRKLVDALEANGRARFEFSTLAEPYVAVTFHAIYFLLARRGLSFLRNSVTAIIGECVSNSYKANLKRAHFDLLRLAIDRAEDYERGMASFQETLADPERCDSELRRRAPGLYITLEVREASIRITIGGTGGIVAAERKNIEEKLHRARRMENFLEELEQARAGAEGAGLGILLSFSLLRESGIGEENLQHELDETSCRAHLEIPADIAHYARRLKDHLPAALSSPILVAPARETRPVLRQLSGTDASLPEYRRIAEEDPGLALEILSLAGAHGEARVDSVAAAITAMETSRPGDLLATYRNFSATEVSSNVSPVSTAPSYSSTLRGSRMARLLALRGHGSTPPELAATAALLRNIGYEFLRGLVERNGAGGRRHQSAELQVGMSAAECGARLVEHRNLAPELITAVRYFEIPSALEDIPELVHIVHLADVFVRREQAPNDHPCIYCDLRTLDFFGLAGEDDLARLHAETNAQLKSEP